MSGLTLIVKEIALYLDWQRFEKPLWSRAFSTYTFKQKWFKNLEYIENMHRLKTYVLHLFMSRIKHPKLSFWCVLRWFATLTEEIESFSEVWIWYTGCPNKHGNSVSNSISSLQIILWFSIVIPTEKAVICFVCYVHILFVYVLTACVLSKTRKLQNTHRVNLSVFTFNLEETL